MNAKDKEILRRQFREEEELCEKLISIMTLIANKIRFRVLCLLSKGDFCVTEIVETIGNAKISNVSQQLRLLTLAGILERRRDRKRIIYSLKDEKVRHFLNELMKLYR